MRVISAWRLTPLLKKGRHLAEVSTSLVVDAFVDVADDAGHDLLGGCLPDRIFGLGDFGNEDRGDVLDVGGAIAAIRANEIEWIVAMGPVRPRREQEDLIALRLAVAGSAAKDLALEIGDDHRAFMGERVRDDVAGALPRTRRPDDQMMTIVVDAKDLASETAEDLSFPAEPSVPPQRQQWSGIVHHRAGSVFGRRPA